MLRLRLAESPACMRSSATGNNACQLQSRIQGRHCRLRGAQSGRIPGRAPSVGHGRAWRAPRCVEPALSTEIRLYRDCKVVMTLAPSACGRCLARPWPLVDTLPKQRPRRLQASTVHLGTAMTGNKLDIESIYQCPSQELWVSQVRKNKSAAPNDIGNVTALRCQRIQ